MAPERRRLPLYAPESTIPQGARRDAPATLLCVVAARYLEPACQFGAEVFQARRRPEDPTIALVPTDLDEVSSRLLREAGLRVEGESPAAVERLFSQPRAALAIGAGLLRQVRPTLCVLITHGLPWGAWDASIRGLRPLFDLELAEPRPGVAEAIGRMFVSEARS